MIPDAFSNGTDDALWQPNVRNRETDMARPVKDTPVLTGKDARRFEQALKRNETAKVPREEYERAIRTFARIKLSDKARGA
jgi:hypothetical protein